MRAILIGILWAAVAFAQSFNGFSLGMAENDVAITRGVHSIGANPANVAVPRGNAFELNVFDANIAVFNNAFSYHSYQTFFVTNGEENYWDSDKKQAFLDLVPNDGLNIDTEIRANVFGLAFNNFALAVYPVLFSEVGNPEIKTLLDMALNGINFTKDYKLYLSNFAQGSGLGAVAVSLNYAYPIPIKQYLPDFSFASVGIGVNYYIGLAGAKVEEANAHVVRQQFDGYETVESSTNFSALVAYPEEATPAGKGRSYDFGLSALYKDKWFVSLSFLNIGGKVHFSTNTERYIFEGKSTAFYYEDIDSSVTSVDQSTDTTLTVDPFDMRVPAFMRLGVSYYFRKNLLFTAEWRQGLNRALNNSTTPRLGLGVQYKPLWWLPLRSGIAVGGKTGFLMGFGLGLDFKFVSFNLSYAMKNALWPTHSEGLLLGANLMFRL